MFYPCQQIVDQRFICVLVICVQIFEQIGLKAIWKEYWGQDKVVVPENAGEAKAGRVSESRVPYLLDIGSIEGRK